MCGILGALPSIDEHIFKNALDKIAHRGPDGYGIWTSQDKAVTLGHRRLSIIDLSDAGSQPMHYADGRYAMTFNGEIYNYLEIRETLIKSGFVFKSQSDSEVLMAAYIKYGEDCVNHFNGMWALAIWDNQEKKLFLSRDRLGKKPLFYIDDGRRFIFGSEMKALYGFVNDFSVSEDFDWIKRNIFFYESTDKCLIKGIKRFPAGHTGVYHKGKLVIKRFWNTLDHIEVKKTSYEEQVDEFSALLEDSCRIRMRSDVPLGTALSGGLDSSAILAFISDVKKIGIEKDTASFQHAFVASFSGTELDETKYARSVTDTLGVKATFCEIDPLENIQDMDQALYQFEDIYITSPIPMIQIYHEIKRSGITVSLDGHGSDEMLSGYRDSLFYAFLNSGLDSNELKSIAAAYRNITPGVKDMKIIMDALKFSAKVGVKSILGKNNITKDKSHPNYHLMDQFTKHLYMLTHESILPTLLRNYDRYSMINGIEIRMPFLDHRLVSFCFSLPYTSKIRNGFTKAILRSSIDKKLPAEVVYRKDKIGFGSPMTNWIKGPLKEYFFDHINSAAFKETNLIDQGEVKMLFEGLIRNPKPAFMDGQLAWTSIMPYLWQQATFKRR